MTLQELIERYIAERVARGELNGYSPVVIRNVLSGWAVHCCALELNEIGEEDVLSWIADESLRPATRRSMVSKLRPFVRWLVARDYIRKDFTALIRAPKVPDGMARYLEADQVRVLVRATHTNRDRLIVLLMVHLGLRRIEVSRIDLDDVDLRDRLLKVRGKNGQGRVTRSLPITAEVHGALVAYLAERPAVGGPLIRLARNSRRMPETEISRMMGKLMVETGIKRLPYDGMSGHALRHTCAQELIDAGTDIRLVQAALGHRSIQTTENYLRRQPPGLRAAMEGRKYTTG